MLGMHPYAPVLVLLLTIIGIVVLIMVLTHTMGPKRRGARKELPYEAGVPPIGDAHRRFSVRFYIVALLFLLFDVEVVFLWPWAKVFYRASVDQRIPVSVDEYTYDSTFLLLTMGFFAGLLVVGLAYEWRKGALKLT